MPLAADRLTPLIPYAVEKRIGEVADKQVKVIFDGKQCENPAGKAAFRKLVDMLRQAGEVERDGGRAVISNEIANAIACPAARSTCSRDSGESGERRRACRACSRTNSGM